MSHINYRNVLFITVIMFVVTIVFAYILMSNNIDETISTDIRQVTVEDE